MCSLLYAMDAATYLTAGLIDSHVEDIMLESAILKVFTSDALWQILYDSMQILGGRCFFTDQPYERMMRDARLNMIGEGSNEVLRAFIGVVGMRDVGVELKETVDAWKRPFSDFGKLRGKSGALLSRLRLPKIPVRSRLLKEQADELAQVIRKLSWQVVRLLARHREDIVEKQLELNRVSSVVMAVYVSAAVLSKLDTDLQKADENPRALGHDFAIGTFFIDSQMKLCRRWFNGMGSNSDEAVEKLSDQITGLL